MRNNVDEIEMSLIFHFEGDNDSAKKKKISQINLI